MRRLELFGLISSTANIIQWCRSLGLMRTTMCCPECGHNMVESSFEGSGGVRCRCSRSARGRRHYKYASIREGSIFANIGLSLQTFLYLLYEWSVETPLQGVCYEPQLTKRTVIKQFRLCRAIARKRIRTSHRQQLGGSGRGVMRQMNVKLDGGKHIVESRT